MSISEEFTKVFGDDISAKNLEILNTIFEENSTTVDAITVEAAGALMDSEVTNLAAVKAFDPTDYATSLGVDDNYVTDAEKTVIGNTSGTNTGDQDLSNYQTIDDTDVSGNGWVIDEDDMSSDSATKVPTQQSVKAYVDDNAGGLANLEDSGANVVNSTAGTGYFQWDNVKIDGSILSNITSIMQIANSTGNIMTIGTSGFYFNKEIYASSSSSFDLGRTTGRWRNLLLTGNIAETFTRVTQAYFTDHTTTNAETVDSDMRLKDLVQKIPSGLEVINRLSDEIEYTWKPFETNKVNKLGEDGEFIVLEPEEKDEEGNIIKEVVYEQESVLMDSKTSHFGFSAQELKAAQESAEESGVFFPKLVREHEDGYLHIAYTELIPFLTKAVKELSAKVEELEEKLNSK